jgi:hypothetical protein
MLKETIYSNPTLVDMIANDNLQGVVDFLNNKNIAQTDSSLKTIWNFGDKYGDVAMGGLLTVLEAVGVQDIRVKAALLAYQTRGLDLANDKIQTQIDGIIQAVPSAEQVLTLLKLEGKWYVSLAEQIKGSDVTINEIQSIINEKLQSDLEGFVRSKAESAIAHIRQGTLTSENDVLTFLGTS